MKQYLIYTQKYFIEFMEFRRRKKRIVFFSNDFAIRYIFIIDIYN